MADGARGGGSERGRPRPGGPRSDAVKPVSIWFAAPITTSWAAIVGFAPVLAMALLVWAADSRSTAPAADAIRFTLDVWLLAHGVPISAGGILIGLPPLLWSLFIVWHLWRAGISSAKAIGAHEPFDAVRVALGGGVVYGALGAGAAAYGRLPDVFVTPWIAGPILGVLAAVTCGAAALWRIGWVAHAWTQFSTTVRHGAQAGAAAAIAVTSAGSFLVAVSLAFSAELAREMFTAPTPGVVGGIGLLMVCVMYGPTLAGWGTAYAAGPGFSIGADTSVTPFTVDLGPVPAVPLLAAVPTDGGGLRLAVLGIPVLAGLVSGAVLARRLGDDVAWRMLASCGIAGLVAGAACGTLAVATGGPLGAGRLASVGPSAWRLIVVITVTVGVGAVIAACLTRWLAPTALAAWRGARGKPVTIDTPEKYVRPARPAGGQAGESGHTATIANGYQDAQLDPDDGTPQPPSPSDMDDSTPVSSQASADGAGDSELEDSQGWEQANTEASLNLAEVAEEDVGDKLEGQPHEDTPLDTTIAPDVQRDAPSSEELGEAAHDPGPEDPVVESSQPIHSASDHAEHAAQSAHDSSHDADRSEEPKDGEARQGQ